MEIIRKSPFKVDKIENDPNAFGNRPKEVIACVESLFNDRHIIISGPRGVGKSSLASQIQNFYKRDFTLAKRCGIKIDFDKYLTCFYPCAESTTLSSFALDLIFRIENQCIWIKNFKTGSKTKFEASLNLGIIKAGLQTDIITNKPASIATQFVNGLNNIYKSLISFTEYKGINILVDELDRLNENINFGHFFKVIHEYLIQDGLTTVNFIFAGQKGIYTHLYQQDPSIERIVRHVPISKLENEDECRHILNYASSKKAKPAFFIRPDAEELILKIASGFPYVIQLLGDAAFFSMSNPRDMTETDVLLGLEIILKADKNEKYYSFFNDLFPEQRVILAIIAKYRSKTLPMIIPFSWIISEAKNIIEREEEIIDIVKSLSKKGHIIINEEKEICQFNDELFRIFLSLLYLESAEIKEEITSVSITDTNVKEIVDLIESSKYSRSWEFEKN